MTKQEILEKLRSMAKYPTVTLPRDSEALRKAADLLEEQDEPVAWEQFHEHMAGPNYIAPQRTWVGLTKEEINQGLLRSFYVLEKARAWRDGVAWAEEILKEKNNAI